MRTEYTASYRYEILDTTRDGTPIRATAQPGSGAFSAIVHASGEVQGGSIEAPYGETPREMRTLADVQLNTPYNIDDEGSRVLILLEELSPWTPTGRTFPDSRRR